MTKAFLTTLFVVACVAPCRAEVQTKTIEYEQGGVQLAGLLAWDDAVQGERPGVLVVHEWWGLNDYAKGRAKQLAELGYVAFALDMYGKDKVTEHASEASQWSRQIRENTAAWQSRALAGLRILKAGELVDDDRVAAIGYCFGGSTVLTLAYGGTDLAGVVSFHGGLMPPTEEQQDQIKAPILICHGAADSFIPGETAQKVRAALESAGADWQMIYYGGARHSFTNPAADEKGIEGIQYNQAADRRSWEDMRQFFDEIFASH